MDMKSVEAKWQKIWDETKAHEFKEDDNKKKHYVLEMFSYPSGAKLHVGHWWNYGLSDSYARFMKMKGFNVFQPMGFDAFGLPAENYAIKTGIHPKDSTYQNLATMEEQLKKIGAMFDWSKEIQTCGEDYYRWTQWMFLKFYEKGLAYRKEAPVNWCPSCNTVLANEQVNDGICERCSSVVIKKNLTQWFLKITDYAEELLQGLETLDWPEKTKAMQKNWIGKSQGGEIVFKTESGEEFTVFTTRADTVFGVTYVVLAPEHPLVEKITTNEQKEIVESYLIETSKVSEIDRLSSSREKTGAFTGAYAISPVSGKKIPILVADYVLYSYGTGAVMGVAAHDERDFEFAKKLGLPIETVVESPNGETILPYTDYGILVNSGKFDGMKSEDAIVAILKDLKEKNLGGEKTNYRLRDWLVSRQRYWGTPIPMIHCPHCGTVPVPYSDLPVVLPYDVEFAPDGKSPLAKSEEFINVKCPVCGKPAKRDADTLDTFVCSSWYFLRYPDAHNDKAPFDTQLINRILPVDKYIGGAEHACMHLLYARFFTKALRDMGYLNFDEPFTSLVHQGVILGPDGQKMSKSRGNVISPDVYVDEFGSDVFRLSLHFGFSYIEGGPWNVDGIKSASKFLDRVEKIVDISLTVQDGHRDEMEDEELRFVLNNTIKSVETDLPKFSFNTSVARIMELVNALYKYYQNGKINRKLFKETNLCLIKLMAPFVPHFAEELNERVGSRVSVFYLDFPVFDENALTKSSVEFAIQINSKIKGKMLVSSTASDDEIRSLAESEMREHLENKTIVKAIIIKNKLVNLVVK